MKKYLFLIVAILATACSKNPLAPAEEDKTTPCVEINGEVLKMKAALEFVSNATAPVTMKMVGNWVSTADLTISNRKSVVTLDLNGNEISVPKVVSEVDTLLVTDKSKTGDGAITSSGTTVFKLTRSYVKIDNGKFSASNQAFTLDNRSKAVIVGGCFYVSGKSLAYNTSMVSGGKAYIYGGHFNFHPIIDADANSVYFVSIADSCAMKYDKNYLSLPDPRCTLEAVKTDVKIGFSYYGGSTGKGGKGFCRVIEAAGAMAVGFEAYATTTALAQEYISSVDGLIIPGSAAGDDDNRNAYEFKLLDQIVAQGKPVLGICYGHQRINKYKGGNVPAVTTLAPSTTIKHKNVDGSGYNVGFYSEAHSITIDNSSKLYELMGNRETIKVNTSHNYALGTIGTGLKVVATAPDGIVEAIESTDGNKMTGVQFHPEGMYNSLNKPEFLPIFEELVRTARSCKK